MPRELATPRGPAATAALVYAALVIAAAGRLPPIPDETYYWAWSRQLGLGYLDHPPGVAWVLAASSALFGPGLLGLRLPSLLAMAACASFTVLAVHRLAPPELRPRARALALLVLAGAPMFAVGYLPATPDPYQGAAAALSAWLVVCALEPRGRFTALARAAAGFVLSAAVLLKHSSGVLALGALAGAAAVPAGRRALRTPAPWLGVAAGLLALAPWLAGELGGPHGSVAFQATRVLGRGTPRGPAALAVLVGGLALALGPSGVLALLGLWPRRRGASGSVGRAGEPVARPGSSLAPAAVVSGAGALALIAACLVPVWRGGGELNWSMPALVFALPPAAVAVVARGGGLERWTRRAAVVGVALMLVALAHVARPFLPIPPARDTTLRGAGYAELAAEAQRMAARSGARALVTRRYQSASELRYHLGDALPVVELGGARPSQYDAWPRPSLRAGEVVLLVLGAPALPPELDVTPLTEVPAQVYERQARGAPLERWWISPVRLAADAFAPEGSAPGGLARGTRQGAAE